MKIAKPYVPASMSPAPVVARLAVAAPLTAGRSMPQAKPAATVKAATVQVQTPAHIHDRHKAHFKSAHEAELKRLAMQEGYRAAKAAHDKESRITAIAEYRTEAANRETPAEIRAKIAATARARANKGGLFR